MPLFVLSETTAGYALFKAKDKKLLEASDLASRLDTAQGINSELKLKELAKWDSAQAGLEEVSGLVEGKVTPMLAKLLESLKDEKKISLAVADKNLGNAINKLPQFNITSVSDSSTVDLYRGIRGHLTDLIPGLQPENLRGLALGLSHSLSRHKLKFSPDKVDIMVVQAIGLLDDLDKELNTYAMRVKEWYGWHFPELGKILNDNLAYARVIMSVGMRTSMADADLQDILPEEIESAVKSAAEVSMGTEIANEDLENIQMLAAQVVSYSEYRIQLSTYLESRMKAIAPNLTELVGTLVGARLIAHAGSLMSLAKNPGSTIQILGAEKALFRALKTKHATPKYGLIYHASLVGQATGKNKGKIARQLASRTALGIRIDALGDFTDADGKELDEEERAKHAIDFRIKLENNVRRLEGRPLASRGAAIGPDGQAVAAPSKWDVKEARKYNIDADGLAGDEPAAVEPKKSKKDKKKLIEEVDTEMADENGDGSVADEDMADADAPATAPTNGTNGNHKLSEKEAKKLAKKAAKASKAAELESTLPESSTALPALTKEQYEEYAEAAGMSASKFQRKYERGDVELGADGKPKVLSKKELKKLRKAEDVKGSSDNDSAAKLGEKRKRESLGGEEKPKQKKKKSKGEA